MKSTWRAAWAFCILVVACASGGSFASAQTARAGAPVQFTPITMRVQDPPVPVEGSDGRMHLVYELALSNFTGAGVAIQGLDVLDAKSGNVVATLQPADIAGRLVVRDKAAVKGSVGASQIGLLYVHVSFVNRASVPQQLAHRATVVTDGKRIVETGGQSAVAAPTTLVLDPPLRGSRYIAGDGCCDAPRHVRASLPLDGQLFTAQRFAIDWEQLDEQGRIYVGDPKQVKSYRIYGQPIYAVADGTVVTALDGLPDSPPGALPPDLPIEQADGNHVVLDIGGGRFALFAHMAPGSVRVHAGDAVRAGDVIGLVGSSGNSSEPHLHFHVVDGPSPLASNGLPYLLRNFGAARRGVSTAAYDQASSGGTPIATEPVAQPGARRNMLPLDLWIVDLPS